MLPSDYHLHTPLCHHAEGNPVEYAAVAVERGLSEIGFADHSPMPEYFDDWRMLKEDLPRYLELVEEARSAYPELTIKLGMECDYLKGCEEWIEELAEMADFDYLIGSVHYLPDAVQDKAWDFDNPKWLGRWEAGGESSVEEIWKLYWKQYEEAIRSGLFDIMGHPDLVKKFGFRPSVVDSELRRYYEGSVQALVDTGKCYEINTSGLHKEAAEMYPARGFVEMAVEAGVPLVISSDAHKPEEVARDQAAAIALAQQAGYTEVAIFTKRERASIALSISSESNKKA